MKSLRKAHFCGKALYNMLESGFSALLFESMAINYTILLKPCSDVKTIFPVLTEMSSISQTPVALYIKL